MYMAMYRIHKKVMYIFVYFAYCILVHVDVQYNQKEGGSKGKANQEHTADEVQTGIRVSEGTKPIVPNLWTAFKIK